MAASKKPSLADVAMAPDPEGEPEDDGGAYDASLDELAEVLNVPADKMDAFRESFMAACMSCK